MSRFPTALICLAWLLASGALGACTRASESSPPPAGNAGRTIDDDVKGVAKATKKTAEDIGHATSDLAEKAGKGLDDATNKASVGGQDAWITTKVKSELVKDGFDPLHVHVDTDNKVVTLSGTVESATKAERAVDVSKGITGVAAVKNHLFVKPGGH